MASPSGLSTCPTPWFAPVSPTLTDNSDGTWTVTSTPQATGSYSLVLSVNGEFIGANTSSCVTLQVLPSFVWTFAFPVTATGEATVPAAFSVTAKDQFSNNVVSTTYTFDTLFTLAQTNTSKVPYLTRGKPCCDTHSIWRECVNGEHNVT